MVFKANSTTNYWFSQKQGLNGADLPLQTLKPSPPHFFNFPPKTPPSLPHFFFPPKKIHENFLYLQSEIWNHFCGPPFPSLTPPPKKKPSLKPKKKNLKMLGFQSSESPFFPGRRIFFRGKTVSCREGFPTNVPEVRTAGGWWCSWSPC